MITNIKELVSQIKSQTPIQELISEYVVVKKSGSGYSCICPFHDDHHPSLQIHPQKGIFKCFACGTGGDLITFYSLINKKKWHESIHDLATKYGFKIEYENKVESKIKKELYELNNTALSFFKENLKRAEGEEALRYLKNTRKLEEEIIEKYHLGFALNEWDSLYKYLKKEKLLSEELIIASGLFVSKQNSDGYYDRFRNRIVFPILDEFNNIIGFGGRAMNPDEPKYINSPETLIFNKGQSLYGLNIAKEEIKKLDYAILTEGYMDVISAHQNNLLNTVATLGTAVTVSQLKLLSKHSPSNKIFLCLDTDLAGIKAITNIHRITQETNAVVNLDIRAVSGLPKKDLDESLNEYSASEIRKIIESSAKLIDFILNNQIKNYLTTDGELSKKTILEEIINTLVLIKDPMEQRSHIKLASHKLNFDEELFIIKVKNKIKDSKRKKDSDDSEEDKYKMHSLERFKHAEIELLCLYISLFPLTEDIKEAFKKIDFIDEKHKLIKEQLDNIADSNFTIDEVINYLLQEFGDFKHITSLITDVALKVDENHSIYIKSKEKIIKESMEWINWWITNKKMLKDLTNKLKECKDKNSETNLLIEISNVIKNKASN